VKKITKTISLNFRDFRQKINCKWLLFVLKLKLDIIVTTIYLKKLWQQLRDENPRNGKGKQTKLSTMHIGSKEGETR
jgi:hypothetical protein